MQKSLRDIPKEKSNKQNSLRNTNNQEPSVQSFISDMDSKSKENSEKKTKNTKVIFFSVIMLFFLIGGVLWYLTTRTVVPDVTGMTVENATNRLEKAELKAKVEYQSVKENVNEHVISQTVEKSKRVKKGNAITITVVKEAEYLVIDNYSNQKYESVKAILYKKNIKTSVKQSYHNSIKKGRIIKQDVEKGTKVYEGETINFTISKGHEKTTVPNVEGMSRDNATKTLKKAKLKVNTVYEYSDNVSVGDVIRQGVDVGISVNTGTSVTIVVSRGKRPVEEPNTSTSKSKPKPKPKPDPWSY